jgi:hypothetical protein
MRGYPGEDIIMRRLFHAAFGVALASVGCAHASGLHFSTSTCNHDYAVAYDMDVTGHGLVFHRADGASGDVVMRDGTLISGGHLVPVSAADAEAMRRYESGVRQLVPEVAAVARQAVMLGYAAMATVATSFADPEGRKPMLDKLRQKQADALRGIDTGLGAGHWSSARMTETIAGAVSDGVGEMVGSVTAGALTAALSGDGTQLAALTAKARSLESSMDKELDRQAKALDARASRICPALNELAALQSSWGVRATPGARFAPLTQRPKDDGNDVQTASAP